MRIAFFLLILAVFSSPALGCICTNRDGFSDKEYRKRLLAQNKSIFEGEVLAVGEERTVRRKFENGDSYDEAIRLITFSVTRTWLGPHGADIIVETAVDGTCKFLPKLAIDC